MSDHRVKLNNFAWTSADKSETINITVRSRMGVDEIDQSVIIRAVHTGTQLSERDATRLLVFSAFVLQTEHIDGHNFVWATADDSADKLRAAFEAWKELPASLMVQWRSAIQEVDAPFSS